VNEPSFAIYALVSPSGKVEQQRDAG